LFFAYRPTPPMSAYLAFRDKRRKNGSCRIPVPFIRGSPWEHLPPKTKR
jgi:hypothetical protein